MNSKETKVLEGSRKRSFISIQNRNGQQIKQPHHSFGQLPTREEYDPLNETAAIIDFCFLFLSSFFSIIILKQKLFPHLGKKDMDSR